MRYVVLIFAILGLGTTGFLGYRWWRETTNLDNQEKLGALKKADEQGSPSIGPQEKEAIVEFDKRTQTWPFLFGAVALGVVGCGLILNRQGLLAALCFLTAAAVPGFFNIAGSIFATPLILAGILALFVRRRNVPDLAS